MEATGKHEMISNMEKAKHFSTLGMYGRAATIIGEFAMEMDKSNINYSLSDEILEALICKDTLDDCGDSCGEMGIGGCCCTVGLLVLGGWGCACLCPECECCGECSTEFFDTCICRTGKGILGVCWDTCCCCC